MPLSAMKNYFKKLFFYKETPHQFALSCSFAMYVAISPFIGLHTLMLIGIGWFFNLNVPLLVGLGYAINNPFTLVPIILGTYYFGYWLLHSVLGVSIIQSTPLWMVGINNFLNAYVGLSDISFWAFMCGANILGVLLALLTYPFSKKLFIWWKKRKNFSNNYHNHHNQ